MTRGWVLMTPHTVFVAQKKKISQTNIDVEPLTRHCGWLWRPSISAPQDFGLYTKKKRQMDRKEEVEDAQAATHLALMDFDDCAASIQPGDFVAIMGMSSPCPIVLLFIVAGPSGSECVS
jgi:hypothetical protein